MGNGITAVLLAGGQSTRMGADKAFIALGGQLAWQRQLAELMLVNPEEMIISANAGQRFLIDGNVRVVRDEFDSVGPIGGLVTALRHARTPRVLVLGIDLLQMPGEFLRNLCASAFLDSGLVYRSGTRFEPLAALYPRSLLPLAEQCLRDGQLSLQGLIGSAIEDGAMQSLAVPLGARDFFANANTLEDLAAIKAGDGNAEAPVILSDAGQAATSTAIVRCTQPEAARGASLTETDDQVATEAPLEIRVEGKSIAVVMRTPGHDEELVLGFLISEGVLKRPEDVFQVSHCTSQEGARSGNVIDVMLRNPDAAELQGLTRHVFSSSSCGICGKATLDSVFVNFPKVEQPLGVDASVIFGLPSVLRAAQETFETTGGLHASAVFDRSGNLLILREDVGRHNALDKVLGAAFSDGLLPLNDHILLVSGRISFELMQKSLAAGIPIIAGISAPSSLAVDFARESRQTLCGFLRNGRMNIYAHPDRILAEC
ncbi:MAG: formate dehydrogenase accessory sulfurtransferase FdhD [Verrucomicrobiae bacterium]|nr:formate dehydrogenase accessory sulfurtransferase FdhD [Verrucomicrobiae bacterium]